VPKSRMSGTGLLRLLYFFMTRTLANLILKEITKVCIYIYIYMCVCVCVCNNNKKKKKNKNKNKVQFRQHAVLIIKPTRCTNFSNLFWE